MPAFSALAFAAKEAPLNAQVFLEIVMEGNLAEKSFAFAATVIAIFRATAL